MAAVGRAAAAGGAAAGRAGVPGRRVRGIARPGGAGARRRRTGRRHSQRTGAQRADPAGAAQRGPHSRLVAGPGRRAAGAAPRTGAAGVARRRPAAAGRARLVLCVRPVRADGAHPGPARRAPGLRERPAGVRPLLLAQLLLAHEQRPGHGADGDVPAGRARRRSRRLPGGDLRPARPVVGADQQGAAAQPRPGLHRGRWHPAGAAQHRLGQPQPAGGQRPAGPAGPHADAAAGEPAQGRRPVPQRADGGGGCALAGPAGGAGAAGARHAAAPARRDRGGRGAGLPQGDGELARDRAARARHERPRDLCEPRVLPDGGLLR